MDSFPPPLPLGTLRGLHILLHPVLISRDASQNTPKPQTASAWLGQSFAHLLASAETTEETFSNNTTTLDVQYLPDPARTKMSSFLPAGGAGPLSTPSLFIESNYVALVAPNPNPENKPPLASFGFAELGSLIGAVDDELAKSGKPTAFSAVAARDAATEMVIMTTPHSNVNGRASVWEVDYAVDQSAMPRQ